MPDLDAIVKDLPRIREEAERIREVLLAHLVMIGEIPAPTGMEEKRIELILQRWAEAGLQNCSTDEKGNGIALLPGEGGGSDILLAAHADTFVEDIGDQTVEIGTDRVVGPFVGDNSLALAALVTLPTLLERLSIRLKSNVLLLATTRALGRGNLEGLKFFLQNATVHPTRALCLEGVQLGRLNYSCLGMLRGEIAVRLPDNYDWAQFGATGSIIPMNDVINRINKIALPRRPLTSIVLGALEGGLTYSNIARETTLRFEVRSESAEILDQVSRQIGDIAQEVAAQSGVGVELDLFAHRQPGGLEIAHPLVQGARAVLTALGLQPMLYPTTSAMSALVDQKIPALTLGVTTGIRRNQLDEIDEEVAIAPMFTGLAQLVGVLQAIDGGPGHGA